MGFYVETDVAGVVIGLGHTDRTPMPPGAAAIPDEAGESIRGSADFSAFCVIEGRIEENPAHAAAVESREAARLLAESDTEMARGVEDLFAALIAKGTLAEEDIPLELKTKIDRRAALRAQIREV